jgi:hypothetical protein
MVSVHIEIEKSLRMVISLEVTDHNGWVVEDTKPGSPIRMGMMQTSSWVEGMIRLSLHHEI